MITRMWRQQSRLLHTKKFQPPDCGGFRTGKWRSLLWQVAETE